MARPIRIQRAGGWYHATARGNERRAIIRDPRGQTAQAAYRASVESPVRQGLPESPWEQLAGQVVLGGAEFVRRMRVRVQGNWREQRGVRRLAGPAWRK